MNRALPPRDRGDRRETSCRAPGYPRAVHGSVGLGGGSAATVEEPTIGPRCATGAPRSLLRRRLGVVAQGYCLKRVWAVGTRDCSWVSNESGAERPPYCHLHELTKRWPRWEAFARRVHLARRPSTAASARRSTCYQWGRLRGGGNSLPRTDGVLETSYVTKAGEPDAS